MDPIINTFVAISIISLISLIGAFALALTLSKLQQLLTFLVSFAAGALIGDTFIHLIPEIIASTVFSLDISLSILLGILFFFILEKFLHWHHCHEPISKNHHHPLATINLVSDGFHNFIDGIIIAGSFLVNPLLGLTTTIAVALHEIPQEIGDFGILIHAGLSRTKALWLNFLSSLMAFFGAGLTFFLSQNINNFLPSILAFTAGSFIYIALADLIPELHKEKNLTKSLWQFIALILGITVMTALLLVE